MAGAIDLHQMGNEQGSYYLLNLHSGKRIIRNNWTVQPVLSEERSTVHPLAAACRTYKGIVFTDKDGNILNEINGPETDKHDNLEITGV